MRFYVLSCLLGLTAVVLMGCGGNDPAVELDAPNVLYHDEFAGQMGAWDLEGDALGSTAVADERLVIELKETGVMQYAALTQPTFSDFSLEVEARLLSGDMSNSFGVLFRQQTPQQFYRFEITGDGNYMVERLNPDGSWTRPIADWTATPAINQGLTVPNHLKIVANGATMSFYVNDFLVQQMADTSYPSGTIALDAGTFTDGGIKVAFDNLVIKTP